MEPALASRAAVGADGKRRSAVKDTVKFYSQNSRGLRADKLEEVLATMKKEDVFVWMLQETWRLKTEEHDNDDGYVTINHGPDEKLCRRGSLGVMVVLSPEAVKAYERGGSMRQTYGLRVLSVKLVLLDDKKREVKLRVVSAYAPTSAASKEEKELYEDNLGQAISDTAEDEILIIGADTNASCGRDNVKLHAGKSGHIPDDEMVQSPVGPHGIDWRNVAGDELMTFLGLCNMCLPMTFFQKKMSRRGTWQHPRSKKDYELDQFMVKRGDLKRVVDAGTRQRHSVYSDHKAIFMEVRIAKGLAKQKERNMGKFSRGRLQDDEVRQEFIEEVEAHLLKLDPRLTERRNDGWRLRKDQEQNSTQGALQDAFRSAEMKCGSVSSRRNPGWFRMSQTKLLRSKDKRNALQQNYNLISRALHRKSSSGDSRAQCQVNRARRKLRSHQAVHKKLVKGAKRKWNMVRVDKVNKSSGRFVGNCWEAARQIGAQDAKKRRVPLTFRDPDTGEKADSAKRSGEVLVGHLEKLLNAVPEVDWDKVNAVRQRDVIGELDAPPDSEEIRKAVQRQNNGKATGDSKIPAEYFKLCEQSDAIMAVIEHIITRAWSGEETPIEWLEGRIKMLPKSGDLLDPGRWRSITLLDAASKIMSTILTLRLNKILKKEGLENQNGFTPGRGTTDGSFCVRTMLAKRHEHGQETWAYFLDLVKAFDTVPREAMLVVLGKFGVPPRMVGVISRMYHNCAVKVELDSGDPLNPKEDFVVQATAGVKQGDNLAPVLFIIYIQAVLEGLAAAFADAGKAQHKPIFLTKADHVIHGRRHATKKGVTSVTAAESLYADDALFMFISRLQLEEGVVIIDRHFTAFGLQVHRGRPGKRSKTECMFFPAPGACYEDADTSNVAVDNGYYTFTKKFKYLGSIITSDLKADEDVATRIRSATGAFNMMRHVLRSRHVNSKEKAKIYDVIVGSVLLYGSECWAMRADLLRKLERFHSQCVRTICGVTRRQQWLKHIRNSTLRKRLGLETIEEMNATRNLRWAGHVARMPLSRLPRALLTGWVGHPRPDGRPQQTFGHALKKNLRLRARQLRACPADSGPFSYNIGDTVHYVSYQALADWLCRTASGRFDKTWLDAAQHRQLWAFITYKKFLLRQE